MNYITHSDSAFQALSSATDLLPASAGLEV